MRLCGSFHGVRRMMSAFGKVFVYGVFFFFHLRVRKEGGVGVCLPPFLAASGIWRDALGMART